MKKVMTGCCLFLAGLSLFAEPLVRPVMGLYSVETNAAQKEVAWSTQPGLRYELQVSTNLQTWVRVDGFPTEAEALAQQHRIELSVASKRFFRVRIIDQQPPVITPRNPASGAFAVPRFSSVSVEISDLTGVDPASVTLTVDGLGSYTVGDPQLSFTNGLLTFDNGGDTAPRVVRHECAGVGLCGGYPRARNRSFMGL